MQVDAAGSYTVTQDTGATKVLGPPSGSLSGTNFVAWFSSAPLGVLGVGYNTADVTAAAGMDYAAPYSTYAGISGTLSTTVPTTGSVPYAGQFDVSFYRGGATNATYWSGGAFTTNVDFDAGTLTGSGTGSAGGNLTVSGTLQGAQFNGTADFTALDFAGATNVPMTGGFYGANTVTGVLQNDQVAGVFYGQ